MQVNDKNLEDVSHEDAVQVLKATKEKVTIVISRLTAFYGEEPAAAPKPAEVPVTTQEQETTQTSKS